ncbi:hypothetical protein Scep_018738 [Stephania cephalantha]|uniref:Uncharacterized protein n=1 Tax=Stephania cephalantha TaxID=152367 RepID=A0AAP0NM64_9MAGN
MSGDVPRVACRRETEVVAYGGCRGRDAGVGDVGVTGLRSRDHARIIAARLYKEGTGSSLERDHARTEEREEGQPSHVDREDTTRGGRSGGGRSSLRRAEEESGHEAGSEEVRGER